MKSIKGFILIAALAVSILLYFGVYGVASRIYHQEVEENASRFSELLARQTFQSMFQIMRRGWDREQVKDFLAANREAFAGSAFSLTIFRGPLVTRRFGPIEQPAIEGPVDRALRTGEEQRLRSGRRVSHVFPLKARPECLRCHTNAEKGAVLGAIKVDQDLTPILERADDNFSLAFLAIAPLPLVVAWGVATLLSRRINRSVDHLDGDIERVRSVADLRDVRVPEHQLGFDELNELAGKVRELADKMRTIAVDKDLLEFEIRLLEKFVITSDVVQDWQEYIKTLLSEINGVMEVYFLFSLFKVEEETYDIELFWLRRPSDTSRDTVTRCIHGALKGNPHFGEAAAVEIHHHVVDPESELPEIPEAEVELQTKTLLLETPKIGGVVGIGVHTSTAQDPTRLLVTESILSTLLNVVGSVRAISKYTRDLEYYASRDPLTDLYNQRTFREFLSYEVGRAQRHDYAFGLLLIDLDNFKNINDRFGHQVGDQFLQQFSSALHEALRRGDVLARYGGDEFLALLPETGSEQAYMVAQRLLEATDGLVLDTPEGARVRATVSIGIAMYPDHADEGQDLFLFADNMMYRAKAEGKHRIGMPTEEDVVEVFRELGEKSHLVQEAFDNKEVIPYYQPIRQVEGGDAVAHEVLSRIHTEGMVLGAGEFIEHAERMGVVHKLDFLVMERAFADARAAGYAGMLFINLSPRALVLQEFLTRTRTLVRQYGIEPTSVVFELTERETVRNLTLLEKFITDLKLDGFQFAVDDFGSGFASFHYLKRLPIDYVKIDGDFVVNMARDPRDHAFVKSMATLASELGIRTIAEFIEDEEILGAVRAVDIPLAQGFHLGHPAPKLD
ncbi:putative bifunctional diguanylate cyclase/phosphodiesterase [Thiohalorhabdus sp. Cl-TMA]|uniref:Bifunctional diguanylate cyclase/phosphodiesterase n=1 Tax=Thiohalorhabdus methylotrophus TaxID=3242694 RepID=A0ABV4TT56_9GAMM